MLTMEEDRREARHEFLAKVREARQENPSIREFTEGNAHTLEDRAEHGPALDYTILDATPELAEWAPAIKKATAGKVDWRALLKIAIEFITAHKAMFGLLISVILSLFGL